MERDAQTRFIGSLISLIEGRDPSWMVEKMGADDCVQAHLVIMDLDGRLREQYAAKGGSGGIAPAVVPPISKAAS